MGILVGPPTRIILSTLFLVIFASFNACSIGPEHFLIMESTSSSSLARVKV